MFVILGDWFDDIITLLVVDFWVLLVFDCLFGVLLLLIVDYFCSLYLLELVV